MLNSGKIRGFSNHIRSRRPSHTAAQINTYGGDGQRQRMLSLFLPKGSNFSSEENDCFLRRKVSFCPRIISPAIILAPSFHYKGRFSTKVVLAKCYKSEINDNNITILSHTNNRWNISKNTYQYSLHKRNSAGTSSSIRENRPRSS